MNPPSAPRHTAATQSVGFRARILLAGDDSGTLDPIETLLSREGYRIIRCAADTETRSEPDGIDLVIADFSSSLTDVPLRTAGSRTENPRVLVMAGVEVMEAALTCLRTGAADDILPKPVNETELLTRVRVCLERPIGGRSGRRAPADQQSDADDTAEARLKENETLFQQVTESIDEAFWLVSGNMKVTLYVSPAYERMWGQPASALRASSEARIERVHTNDRLKIIQRQNRPVRERYVMEYRIRHPEKGIRWIRERGFPVRNGQGIIFRIAVIFSDISEEKKIRQESEQRLQQVIQADRLASLGEVVAGVAHEINNPNSFIAYNLPLLEETWQVFKPVLERYAETHHDPKHGFVSFSELVGDTSEIIQAIRTGSERITRVVDGLKDFARQDVSAPTRPVRVNDVVKSTMTIAGAQLRRAANDIRLQLADDLPEIQGHAQKLEQVLTNLVVNATQAIPKKSGGRLTVTTRHIARLGAVLIEVEDNGKGMHEAVLDRLFEPFFTTRRATGGTGLGLSVSYGLVKEHGGLIGVLSRPGRGTRFTVFLPTGTEPLDELHPKLLCVDDQASVLQMIRSMLIEADGYMVETTSNPDAVMAYLEDHPEVDIVLSDVSMPEINGWNLLERIRARFPLTAVILFSGIPGVFQFKPAQVQRPDAELEKPFYKSDLIRTIGRIGRMRL